MSITIQQLNHIYGGGSPFAVEALRNIDLKIEDGAFVGIIGHTGSGKSTLAQHLNGLIEVQSGTIQVDDIILADKYDKKKLRFLVGMVFQYPEYQLFEETVFKDVCFGPKNMGLSEEEQAERARWALSLMGVDFDTFAQRSPFELSGGEKRRIAIAGVLAMKPKYLVLDEPAAGLDPQARRQLLDMIKNLHRDTGMAIVMVSHSMDDVAECAQQVVVMHQGSIAMTGTPMEVFSQEDALKHMGLDVPASVLLKNRLQEHGLAVEMALDPIGMAHHIAAALKKGESK